MNISLHSKHWFSSSSLTNTGAVDGSSIYGGSCCSSTFMIFFSLYKHFLLVFVVPSNTFFLETGKPEGLPRSSAPGPTQGSELSSAVTSLGLFMDCSFFFLGFRVRPFTAKIMFIHFRSFLLLTMEWTFLFLTTFDCFILRRREAMLLSLRIFSLGRTSSMAPLSLVSSLQTRHFFDHRPTRFFFCSRQPQDSHCVAEWLIRWRFIDLLHLNILPHCGHKRGFSPSTGMIWSLVPNPVKSSSSLLKSSS
ncbi:hypothetical protein GDO81_018896 [Engystomops pustulosus]|uniref:Uncharacterized protein n=1 Tax=Engystomops pustulosus TaxID=76066 RepID=A0AAV6Z2Y4_ENGPU|nr:hypothetical protein GDO81_018896 [Engystomops pustulosus]